MKTKFNFGGTFRISALVFIPVLIILPVLASGRPVSTVTVTEAVLVADFLLLLYPLSYETKKPSVLCFSALALGELVASLSLNSASWRAALPAVVIVAYAVWRTLERCANFKFLFKNEAPLYAMENCARTVKGTVVLSLAALAGTGAVLTALCLASCMFVYLYVCLYLGRTGVMNRDRENSLRNIIKGDLRTSNLASCDEDTRMSALYSRAIAYMDDKKPYLQDDFSLSEFARRLFTNKAYLSRVINYYSGRNFKQFVNYYRVQYSIDLIRKDPHLTVMELATMSGFHSTVTYNMAFRINMNDTPASYSRNCPRE